MDCKRCEVGHKSIFSVFFSHRSCSTAAECSTERPSYQRGVKPGAYKRKSTSRTSIFYHERNYDASDFVNRPKIALTPLPATLCVPVTNSEVNSEVGYDSNAMDNWVRFLSFHPVKMP